MSNFSALEASILLQESCSLCISQLVWTLVVISSVDIIQLHRLRPIVVILLPLLLVVILVVVVALAAVAAIAK